MDDLTDQELLRDYAEHTSEEAFAELVRRHVNLVYSAALRMVHDTHLAEDVTQAVFVAVAQNARQFKNRPVLVGWLHRTAQNIAAQTVRSDVRRRAREQKAAVMNELLATESEVLWEQISAHLDDALGELSEADRDVLLLRYFERKPAREIAQTLGMTEEAAQKRVSRAMERLREYFAKQGVTGGGSGLIVLISANAVQAAPAGLSAAITAAVSLGGTTIATTASATKAIAMTTLQKSLMTALIVVLVAASLVTQQQTRARQRELDNSVRQRSDQLAQLAADNERLFNLVNQANGSTNSQLKELQKLRSEAALLRGQTKELAAVQEENRQSQQTLLREPQTPLQVQEQTVAKQYCVEAWMRAFIAYARANQGQLPASFEQAEPFLPQGVKMGIDIPPDQFEILYHGSLDALANRDVIVLREKKLWPLETGKWGRLYGMADFRNGEANGRSQYCSSSDKTANGTFDNFERDHTARRQVSE